MRVTRSTKGKKSKPEQEPPHPGKFPIGMVAKLDVSSVSFVGIRNTNNKMVYGNLVGVLIHKEYTQATGHYVALVGAGDNSFHIIDDADITTRKQHPITKLAIACSLCVYE